MKNIYAIIIVSTFFVMCSYAQITVQMSEVQTIFTPGTQIKAYIPSLASVNVGLQGGPNNYDFSTLTFADTNIGNPTYVLDVPELVGRYPSTAVIWGSPGPGQTISKVPISEFFNNDMFMYGSASISPDTLRFIHHTPPEQAVQFPLVYNASWNSSCTRTDTTYVNGVPINISSVAISKSMIVDGFGTLIIAGYNLQCLRLKRTLTSPPPSDNEFWYITRNGALLMISAIAAQADTGTVQISQMGLILGQSLVSVRSASDFPTCYSLSQNYPNPFNPTTTIQYSLPSQSFVSLKVFDVLGSEVATLVNEVQTAGYQSVVFNASGLSSGIYLYRIETGSFFETKKLVLLR